MLTDKQKLDEIIAIFERWLEHGWQDRELRFTALRKDADELLSSFHECLVMLRSKLRRGERLEGLEEALSRVVRGYEMTKQMDQEVRCGYKH